MPTPTKAEATVVDKSFALNELTAETPSVLFALIYNRPVEIFPKAFALIFCVSRMGPRLKISSRSVNLPDALEGLESSVIKKL